MEVKTRKRQGGQSLPNRVKKRCKRELATLDFTDPEKLQVFFQENGSTSISLSSYWEVFTPWQGGTSDREMFRLYECGNVYVDPPEDLKVIGYLGHIEEDIVIMVGTQSGRVYMDKDEIVYIVADSLAEFAQHGCRKDPKFYDYYLARPNDVNSLPCAAGTIKDEEREVKAMDTAEESSIDHATLEADLERADQLFSEMGSFLKIPKTADSGHPNAQETCKVRKEYENKNSHVAVF